MLQVIGRKFIDDQARELSFPFFSGYDRIKTVYTIDVEFSIDLSFSNAVVKDGNSLILTSGSWEDYGFIVGADITGNYGANTLSAGTTITYIDGGTLMTDTALSGTDGDSFTSGSIICDVAPDAFEFYFNLIPNSMSGGDASLIDNEVNRFKVYLDSLSIGSTANFTQLGLKSGGTSISATCKRIADTQYEIAVNYNSWGVLLESEFTASACLKPYIRIISFPEYNNPTTSIQTVNTPSDANTGYYNEVGNGGVSAFSVASFDWTDNNFFYNQPSEFTAVINGNFDSTSRFNICVFYDSNNESEYKNLPLSVHDNLMFLTTYPSLGIGTSSGIPSGQRADGAGLNLSIDIDTTSSAATLIGTITPNAEFTTFIESLEESDRKFKLLIRVEDYTLIDNFINPVWLPCSIGTFDKFVEPLGEFTGVISLDLFDHAKENIRTGNQLVTEDDIKIVGLYSLPRFNGFNSLSTEIVVRNGSTDAEFSLEKFTFNLSAFPLLTDGSKPIDQTFNRTFFLSPTNPNQIVRLYRRPDLDDEFTYCVQLEHSYLNNWKEWEAQTNADIYFFPNQDKNWIHYNDSPWSVNHLLTISTDVGDYKNYENILINDYDYIDAEFTFMDLDGNPITKPYQNEKCIVICTHTSVDPFVNFNWAQMTIEPFEGSPRYDISSIYNFDSVVQNPLNPLLGDTLLDYMVSTYTIITKCIFDPSKMVDPSNVSFTSRISARIEKEVIENRHKASFDTAKKPKTYTSEDRGGNECCCSRTVIASQSSNDTYKNDITSNWQIGETVSFELKTCEGVLTAFQPSIQSFPNDVNAKYCTIQWKDVLLSEGCGTFKLYVTYTVAGISTTELKESFTLYEWVDGVESWDRLVNGTCRSMVVLNDANEYEGINFTNANVVDTIRFEGDFNDFQPNMVVRNLQHRDNSIKKVKRENLTRWTLNVYPETICTIDRILNIHLLAENTIYISDYNQYAYDKSILDKAYIVSEQGGGAKIENFGGSSKKGLTCELEPKVQKSKTHFGSVGSSAEPNPTIPPVPNTVSGVCADATLNINKVGGGLISSEVIPSGSTESYTVADSTAVVKNSAGTTLATDTIHATESKDITLSDTYYNIYVNGILDQSFYIPTLESETINIIA